MDEINKILDAETHPERWADLFTTFVWTRGNTNQNVPVEWARERVKAFWEHTID